jgi:undecaprenyl diphosphate synthase
MRALPLDKEPLSPPLHVAIIMDGNGRWARARGLVRAAGHRRGAESVRTAVECAVELGISYLTLYGFSSENWNRPESEVNDLMGLLRFYLLSEIAHLHDNGIRLRVIGDRERLARDIVATIESAENQTRENGNLTLIIALSYGGRTEIATAARSLARAVAIGSVNPEEIDEGVFSQHLFTAGIPDPDLLIRTSGEKRISNFLLWQLAYAEFVFVDTLWPDFSRTDFENAITEYHCRERRYGASGG